MKTGLTHGVFDLLHSGHMAHLEQASLLCDKLVVSVLADRYISKGFVINDERTRMYQVSRVKGVAEVVLCDEAPGPWPIMNRLMPDYYIRKDEYVDRKQPEYMVAEKLGIGCVFTKTVPPHATELIRRIWDLKEKYDK